MRMSLKSRAKISEYGDRFIRDGKVVLVHGFSRVVFAVLKYAAQRGTHFSVIVTEARPDGAGYRMAKALEDAKLNIPVTLVLDAAVANVMEKVDFVLVGAEGVVESGGIINKIGTYTIALVAKAMNRPLYVAAESYKFVRLFPLTQDDLPEKECDWKPLPFDTPGFLKIRNPSADYTPPEYISLFLTDLGVIGPGAVSDELIKLYY